ncbi:MAG: hypothetical protein PVH61_29310 [Candidatus Aminicenantes bacterium]|jgi:hypothetical protein
MSNVGAEGNVDASNATPEKGGKAPENIAAEEYDSIQATDIPDIRGEKAKKNKSPNDRGSTKHTMDRPDIRGEKAKENRSLNDRDSKEQTKDRPDIRGAKAKENRPPNDRGSTQQTTDRTDIRGTNAKENKSTNDQVSTKQTTEGDNKTADRPQQDVSENSIRLHRQIDQMVEKRRSERGVSISPEDYKYVLQPTNQNSDTVDLSTEELVENISIGRELLLSGELSPSEIDQLEANLETWETVLKHHIINANSIAEKEISLSMTPEHVRRLSDEELQEQVSVIEDKLPLESRVDMGMYEGEPSQSEIDQDEANLEILKSELKDRSDGKPPLYNIKVGPQWLENATTEQVAAAQEGYLDYLRTEFLRLLEATKEQKENYNDQEYVSSISNWFGGVHISDLPYFADAASLLNSTRESIIDGDVLSANEKFVRLEEMYDRKSDELKNYTQSTIKGGERSVTGLKIARTAGEVAAATATGGATTELSLLKQIAIGALSAGGADAAKEMLSQIGEKWGDAREAFDYKKIEQSFAIGIVKGLAGGVYEKTIGGKLTDLVSKISPRGVESLTNLERMGTNFVNSLGSEVVQEIAAKIAEGERDGNLQSPEEIKKAIFKNLWSHKSIIHAMAEYAKIRLPDK